MWSSGITVLGSHSVDHHSQILMSWVSPQTWGPKAGSNALTLGCKTCITYFNGVLKRMTGLINKKSIKNSIWEKCSHYIEEGQRAEAKSGMLLNSHTLGMCPRCDSSSHLPPGHLFFFSFYSPESFSNHHGLHYRKHLKCYLIFLPFPQRKSFNTLDQYKLSGLHE